MKQGVSSVEEEAVDCGVMCQNQGTRAWSVGEESRQMRGGGGGEERDARDTVEISPRRENWEVMRQN